MDRNASNQALNVLILIFTLAALLPSGVLLADPGYETSPVILPGTIAGDFSVDSGGGASFTVPIQVSPGTAGMQPAVFLQYNSQAGSNTMGRGWSLGGLSSITRGRKNLQDDGEVQGVTLTDADALFLDGQRLVYVHGQNGIRYYRTLINNHSRIERKRDPRTNLDYFVVYTKAGLIMEYRQLLKVNDGRVLAWLNSEIQDTSGNYVKFNYWVNADGEYGIDRIEYTGNHKTGQTPYASLKFEYDLLPNDVKRTQYVLGNEIATSKKLKSIASYWGLDNDSSSLFRKYELTYKLGSGVAKEYFLHRIQESGETGQKHKPTEFTYSDVFDTSPADRWPIQNSTSLPAVPIATQGEKSKAFAVLDVNGDGHKDIIYSEELDKLYTKVFLGSATTWTESTNNDYRPGFALASPVNRDWRQIDLDGNGPSEILLGAVGDFDAEIYQLINKVWVRKEQLSAIDEIHQDVNDLHFIDFDNDGKRDLLAPSNEDEAQFIAFSQVADDWQPSPSFNLEASTLSVLDIDCDRENDLVALQYDEQDRRLLIQSFFSIDGKWQKNDQLVDIPIDGVNPTAFNNLVQDIDGDGCKDLVVSFETETGGFNYFYTSTTNGLEFQAGLSETLPFLLLGREDASVFTQLNSSAPPELIVTDGAGAKVTFRQESNGQGVIEWTSWNIDSSGLPYEFNAARYAKKTIDVDRDNVDELLLFYSDRDKFDPKLFEITDSGWQPVANRQIPENIAKFDKADLGSQFVDLNGDGLQDLVTASKSYRNTGAGWAAFPGTNFKPPVRIAIENGGDSGTRILDVDGDGLVDFVYAYQEKNKGPIHRGVHLNTGTTWGARSQKYSDSLGNVLFTVEGEGPTGTQMVDLNGDGRVDIIHSHAKSVYENTAYALINKGPSIGWSPDQAYSICTDTLGDYCIQLSLNAKKRYGPQHMNPEFRNYSTGAQIFDLNGDSLPDVLFSYRFAELQWTVEDIAIAKQHWDDANFNRPYPSALANAQAGQINTYEDCYESDIRRCGADNETRKRRNLMVKRGALINTGRGWRLQPHFFNQSMPRFDGAYEQNDQQANLNHILQGFPIDHNADGLLDLHFVERRKVSGALRKSYKVFTNTGNGFKAESDSVWNLGAQIIDDNNVYDFGIRYMEINGDGKIDALQAIQKEDGSELAYKAWLNNGATWIPSSEYKPKLPFARVKRGDQGVRLVDINGDGLLDYLQNFIDSENGKDVPKKGVYLNAGKSVPLLSTIEDGHGSKTHIEYQSMSYAVPNLANKVYVPAPFRSSSWPTIQALPPAHLVRSSSIHIPGYVGGPDQPFNTSYYRYGGFKVNAKSGQPMGFAWKEISNPLTKTRNTIWYLQDCDGRNLTSCYNVGKERKYTSEVLYNGNYKKLLEKHNNYTLIKSSDDDFLSQVYMMESISSTETKWDESGNQTGYKREEITYGGKEKQFVKDTIVQLAPEKPDAGISIDQLSQFQKIQTVNEYNSESLNLTGQWHLARLTKSTVTRSDEGSSADPTTYESRVSCFAYHNETGLLVSERENCGHQKEVQTTYEHDVYGNTVATTISADGIDPRTSRVVYDSVGRLPVSTINPLGHSSNVLRFDQAKGVPLEIEDINGLISQVWVDDFGNMVRTVDPTGLESWVSFAWVENGCTEGEKACFTKTTEVDGLPPTTGIYDAASRQIETNSFGFEGEIVTQKTIYNMAGRVEKSSIPMFDKDWLSNKKVTTSPWVGTEHTLDQSCDSIYQKSPDFDDRETREAYESIWTHHYYDSLGREKATLLPDGGLVCTDHNFREKLVYDQLHNRTATKLDYQLRPFATEDALGGKTQFSYDHAGRLLQTINALGQEINHQYNELGEKIATNDPDLGYWQYEYDALGQLIKQTDAKQQTTYLHYDLLGRLVKKTQRDKTAHWRYDDSPKGVGQLSSVRDSQGYYEQYHYDQFARQIQVDTSIHSQTYTQRVTYDSLGRIETTRSPTGYLQKNNYDANGFVVSVTGSHSESPVFETLWQANAYDAVGRVLSESLGNGVSNFNDYNQYSGHLLETCSKVHSVEANHSDSKACDSANYIHHQSYEYDLADNLTTKVDYINDRELHHQFDELGRLYLVYHKNSFKTDVFKYDAIGNFEMRSDFGTYRYSQAPNSSKSRLESVETLDGKQLTFQYDGNGNTIKSDKGVFSYTSENLVSEIRKSKSQFSTFKYAPSGQRYFHDYRDDRRHLKTTYLGSYEKIEEIGAEPLFPTSERIRHRHYISSPSGVVGVVEEIDWFYPIRHSRNFERLSGLEKTEHTVQHTVKKSYFLKDSMGSVTTVLNNIAAVIDRFEYDAWGKRIEAGRENYNTYRVGYTGHEHLDNLGLIHMNGRVYDPDLGRFISADPFIQSPTNSQSFARYSYVTNNPYKYVDPSGYFKIKIGNPFKKLRNAFNRLVKGIENSIKKVGKWLEENWREIVTVVVVVAVSYACAGTCTAVVAGAMAGFAGGATSAALYGGNIHDVLSAGFKGAVIGAFTAGVAEAWGGVGGMAEDLSANYSGFAEGGIGRALGHGVSGGIASEMQGGDFMQGFGSAAFTHYASAQANVDGIEGFEGEAVARVSVDAAIGGTASVIGGGKFANGAITAAFQSQFNREPHRAQRKALEKQVYEAIKSRLSSKFEKDAFDQYWFAKGDMTLGSEEFKAIAHAAESLTVTGSKVVDIGGVKYTSKQISFYQNSTYDAALGTATVIYKGNSAVGFRDYYNFDAKPWGKRSYSAEFKTGMVRNAGNIYGAKPYNMCFGVGCN